MVLFIFQTYPNDSLLHITQSITAGYQTITFWRQNKKKLSDIPKYTTASWTQKPYSNHTIILIKYMYVILIASGDISTKYSNRVPIRICECS